jgi:hypothetical protein
VSPFPKTTNQKPRPFLATSPKQFIGISRPFNSQISQAKIKQSKTQIFDFQFC